MDKAVLTMPRLPARLDVSQVAARLGFQEYEIAILVRHGLLKPLGNPAQNGHKWFATVSVEECAADMAWLDKATKAVSKHFRAKVRKPA